MTVRATPTGVRLELHVQPGASTTEVAGLHGDRIKLRLAAPPIDGRANEALIRWLSDQLHVPQAGITIVRGETSRRKSVDISGVEVEIVVRKLGLDR